MRSRTVRSVFRGLLTAGLLVSTQTSLLDASWKDRMLPTLGSCFVHDLHWDQCRFSAREALNAAIPKPAELSESSESTEASEWDVAAARELELCLAAAQRFEIQTQATAIAAQWRFLRNHFLTNGPQLLVQLSGGKPFLNSSMKQVGLKLVQWIQIPDALPVTAIVTLEDNNAEEDWNCGDWSKPIETKPTTRWPQRDGGNVFVFVLDSGLKLNDSNSPYEFQNDLSNDTLCSPDIDSNASFSFQVGVDPVCPEIQARNTTPSWMDSVTMPSVCCPPVMDCESNGVEANSQISADTDLPFANRPPILETAYDDSESLLNSESLLTEDWNPLDANVVLDAIALPEEANPGASLYAVEEQYERASLVASARPTLARPSLARPSSMPANLWLNSLGVTEWTLHFGRKLAFDKWVPAMPEAVRPIGKFSFEDLSGATAMRNHTVDNPLSTVSSTLPASNALLTDEVKAQRANQWTSYAANKIRRVAMVLLDFASRIESPNQQIEIANGASQSVR